MYYSYIGLSIFSPISLHWLTYSKHSMRQLHWAGGREQEASVKLTWLIELPQFVYHNDFDEHVLFQDCKFTAICILINSKGKIRPSNCLEKIPPEAGWNNWRYHRNVQILSGDCTVSLCNLCMHEYRLMWMMWDAFLYDIPCTFTNNISIW